MNSLPNLDLLSVGVVVIATCILGFAVYFSNKKSITNRMFLYYSVISMIWGISNYFLYKITNTVYELWSLRILVFLATFHVLFLYQLFLVFPNERFLFSKRHKYLLIPGALLISLLTLTPVVFVKINFIGPNGVYVAEKGFGIVVFIIYALGLTIKTFILLFYKTKNATGLEKKTLQIISLGTILSYSMVIIFNMILPGVFNKTKFFIYTPAFLSPSIILTAYAILKHKLLRIKAIRAIVLIILLLSVVFLEVTYSNDIQEIILRGGIFLLIMCFSIFLLNLIINEEFTKNKIEVLAKELENSNLKLKELDELKSRFVSLATHHIATPLTAIKGYVSLLQEENIIEKSSHNKETLASIERLSDNLVTVIRDYLDVSSIEQGDIKYKFSTVNLKTVIEEIIEEYKFKILNKNIQLVFSFKETGSYMIEVDEEKIRQALSNILDNSIKYTKEGKIMIELENHESQIQLKITDSGIRILPSISPKLLQKFTQTGDKNEADIIGNGLGLYVAKQWIEGCGGKLGINTKESVDGVEFKIDFKESTSI